jgi:hypothetical protein
VKKKQRSEYLTDSDREALTTGLSRLGFDPIAIASMVRLASLTPVVVVPAQARRNS